MGRCAIFVVIYGPQRTYMGEVHVDHVTWNHASLREAGSARLVIPRGHPAFSREVIDEEGDFWVHICHKNLGSWRGIAEVPSVNAEGATIELIHQAEILKWRSVGMARVFQGVTAGTIIRQGFIDAMTGANRAAFTLGGVVLGPPLVHSYEFNGQAYGDVLADMMDLTGCEWALTESGEFSWLAESGGYYQYLLTEDGDVIDSSYEGSLRDMASEITSVNNIGQTYVSRSYGRAVEGFFQRQMVMGTQERP